MNLYCFLSNSATKRFDYLGLDEREQEIEDPSPQLDFEIKKSPEDTAKKCGEVKFVIQWKLKGKSSKSGGYIVQKVRFKWKVDLNCDGLKDMDNWEDQGPDLSSGRTEDSPIFRSPLQYWEAWRVEPNRSGSGAVSRDDGDTDTFGWDMSRWSNGRKTIGNKHCGRVRIEGEAYYHDGVDKLPPHMRRNNPSTLAGGLHSSLQDPNIGGVKSKVFKHWLEFKWNCCPDSKDKETQVIDWGPKTASK
jgi:hypothetical protein